MSDMGIKHIPGFIDAMSKRGYLYQTTHKEELSDLFNRQSVCCYIGFDCTANSLHIGSLIQIMIIRMLLEYGHKVIVLLGGGTTKIGDPSGKEKTRQILTEEDIEANMFGIKKTIEKFLPNNIYNQNNIIFENNDSWLNGIKYINFLRDIGSLFSVNKMLELESVRTRLSREQNLSFIEFNYVILQSFDFIELYKRHNCLVQIGGSDQWGNIINGIELGRKMLRTQLYGITTNLATTSDGKKMGKTESGTVWLDEEKLSPYDYWQYFRNIDDIDIEKFLKYFTNIPEDNITKLSSYQGQKINEAKKILATEATKICHGEKKAIEVSTAATNEFERNISDNIPTFKIQVRNTDIDSSEDNIKIYSILTQIGLTKSNGEAKKLIKAGAVKINDNKVPDISYIVPQKNFKISLGKKRIMIEIVSDLKQ